MFASAGMKDSERNAEESGEFVHSIATFELRDQMNITSAGVGPGVSEPELAKLEMAPSTDGETAAGQQSPIAFECKYTQTVKLPGANGKPHAFSVIIGEIVSIYIDEAVIVDGKVDVSRVQPIARLGDLDEYAVVTAETIFKMKRPA